MSPTTRGSLSQAEQRPSKHDQHLARMAGISRVGALVAMAPWQRHRPCWVQSLPLLREETLKTTHKHSQTCICYLEGLTKRDWSNHRWSSRMLLHPWGNCQANSDPFHPGGPQGSRGEHRLSGVHASRRAHARLIRFIVACKQWGIPQCKHADKATK